MTNFVDAPWINGSPKYCAFLYRSVGEHLFKKMFMKTKKNIDFPFFHYHCPIRVDATSVRLKIHSGLLKKLIFAPFLKRIGLKEYMYVYICRFAVYKTSPQASRAITPFHFLDNFPFFYIFATIPQFYARLPQNVASTHSDKKIHKNRP